ncbi:hypothetical protein [Pseudoalteromonas xiamenensis]
MEFEHQFTKWINKALETEIPKEVVAFCFNLSETSVGFKMELIGSSEFDNENPDWACEEIFEAKPREIEISSKFCGKNWEQCLNNSVLLITKYLGSNQSGAKILNNSLGVAVGFVDGDLEIIKKP